MSVDLGKDLMAFNTVMYVSHVELPYVRNVVIKMEYDSLKTHSSNGFHELFLSDRGKLVRHMCVKHTKS